MHNQELLNTNGLHSFELRHPINYFGTLIDTKIICLASPTKLLYRIPETSLASDLHLK